MSQRRAKTRANLEAAQGLIDKPQKWARAWGGGHHGREHYRSSVYEAVYEATQVSPHPTPEFKALWRAAGERGSDGLLAFERDHTHRELMEVFDRAIEGL